MIDPLEQTGVAPSVEMTLDRAVRRKTVRERSPLAAGSQQEENGLQQQSQPPLRWPSRLRIPTKPAMHSNLKPATDSEAKPAGIPI
jgi:hypothetical protein